jgi:sugar phosphate isomerase/epimerase
VHVACSSLCFTRYSLDETIRTIREQHFQKVDLAIHANGPHLTPSQVFSDLSRMVQKLKACNIAFAAIYCGHYDLSTDHDYSHFRAICRFARLMAIPSITLSPDLNQTDVAAESLRLAPFLKYAHAEGIVIGLETQSQGITGDLPKLKELLALNPKLKITFDPSYFAETWVNYDEIFEWICHVRLRDTGKTPEQFQVSVGQGELDFGKIITHLERVGYDRALSVDIRDVPDSPVPIDAEVRKLKYLLESLV